MKWFLCLCFVLLLAGCGKSDEIIENPETETVAAVEVGELESDDVNSDATMYRGKIAVCIPWAVDGWKADVVLEAEEKLGGLNGIDYCLYTTTDALDQAKQIRGLISENVNSVVIYPVDNYSASEAVAQLQSTGVQVVLFNGSVGSITPDAQVVLNSENLGNSAAELVTGSKDAVVLAFGNESSVDANISYKAFEKSLAEGISIVKGGDTGGDANVAKSLMLEWLNSQSSKTLKTVCAVFAPDEASLRGVMEGLLEYESLPMTTFPNLKVIVGCGGDQALFEVIQSQPSYPIHVFAYSADAIDQAIDTAVNGALGKSVSATMDMGFEEITKDNVGKFIK